MSATFETDACASYFRNYSRVDVIPAPVIFITKESRFQTLAFYIEHFKNLINTVPDVSMEKPTITDEMYKLFVTIVRTLDIIDINDVESNKVIIGNVLVFLPGILEIEEAHRCLKEGENM